jgi:hypothetical protein
VIEVYGFPSSCQASDLSHALQQAFGATAKYAVKWADDTHALISFNSVDAGKPLQCK